MQLFHRNKIGGFTLVELLVALFLSLFLLAVIVQSYLSSKATYRNTTQVSLIQDNVRFTSYFLSADLQEAGNLGCFQDATSVVLESSTNRGLYDFSLPLNIWSYTGTELNGNYTVPGTKPAPDPANGNWRNAAGDPLPAVLSDRIIPGTDVFVITSISENLPIVLSGANPVADTVLDIRGNHELEAGQIVLVGNCQYADIFQHATAETDKLNLAGSATPGNSIFNSGWTTVWQPEDEVRRVNHIVYYIGVGASGAPALFRMRLDRGLAAAPGLVEELVDNVYNLQMVASEDQRDENGQTSGRDNVPDIVVAPTNINQLGDVINVKVSSLHSGDPDTDRSYVDNIPLQTYRLADSVNVTTPDSQLNYMVLNRTIKLQNRGLEREYAYGTK